MPIRGPLAAALVVILLALGITACGGDSEDEGGETVAGVVETDGELPPELVGEIEAVCGGLVTEVGQLEAPGEDGIDEEEYAARVDELQAAALEELEALSDRVPADEQIAWESYLTAQEGAFALSPPASAGEPQPELDAAAAAAEAQAAELGFSSCSSV